MFCGCLVTTVVGNPEWEYPGPWSLLCVPRMAASLSLLTPPRPNEQGLLLGKLRLAGVLPRGDAILERFRESMCVATQKVLLWSGRGWGNTQPCRAQDM